MTVICAFSNVRHGLSGGVGWWTHQQFTGPRQFILASHVGDQSVVADTMEAPGQHVKEKAADELIEVLSS